MSRMSKKFQVDDVVQVAPGEAREGWIAETIKSFRDVRWYGKIISISGKHWPNSVAAGKRGKGIVKPFGDGELILIERPKS